MDDAAALRRLHFGAFLALAAIGLYATSFGPAMETIADDLDVSLDTAGLIITLLFTGSIAASGSLAIWFHHGDSRKQTIAGLGLLSVAMAGLALAQTWPVVVAVALLMGVGDGLVAAGSHELVARTSSMPERAVNRLNVWFAVGAFAGPLWAGAALTAGLGRATLYSALAIAMALAMAVLIAAPAMTRHLVRQPFSDARPASHPGGRSLPRGLLIWAMGLLLFLYVGGEFGLGSWVASYAKAEAGAGTMTGAIVTALYWGALGLGRLWSGRLFAAGWRGERVLLIAVGPATVTSAVLALAGEYLVIGAITAFLTGFFFGPIWPAAIAVVARRSASGAPAFLVTLGNAGGVLFPWLQGRILVGAGPREGIAMTALLGVAMFAIVLWALRRRDGR